MGGMAAKFTTSSGNLNVQLETTAANSVAFLQIWANSKAWEITNSGATASGELEFRYDGPIKAKIDTNGKLLINSGSTAPLNIPILSSDPASPADGDVWVLSSGGNHSLKVRISSSTKSVALT